MDEMRIVIMGKTGVGKSSVSNTILGENVFKIGNTGNSATSECQSETRRVDGRDVTLIDTPGLFDTGRPEEEMKAGLVSCITECSPGPHAFIIVFRVDRFTEQEQDVINKINQYFSEESFKYATLLFTHGDDLDEGQTIKKYFENNHLMSDLMKKCGGRCHVVDNKHWKNNQQDENRSNQFQVKQLLKTIDHMMEANKGSFYTNEMLQKVEELIQEEEEKIRKSPGNMTEEEIRKEAKRRANKKLLINLAGISTGALLGALFGGVLVAGEVLKALKKVLSEEKFQRPFTTLGGVVGGATVGGVGVAVGVKAAVIITGSVIGAGAVAGAVKGGLTGYDAAREADTAGEAAKRAGTAVFNEAKSVFKDQDKAAKNKSESKPLIGPDS